MYIPSSVTDIGYLAFDCSNCSISVDSNNPNYSSIDGILFDKAQSKLIYCPISKTGIYFIPQSVTVIGNYAFDECVGLTSITIPSSVTTIERGAFYYCSSLISVNFSSPLTLTSIGIYAFYNCTSLTSIYIPASVISIGDRAFGGTNCSITIDPDNLNYSSIDGVLFNKSQTTLLQCPMSKSGVYVIPQSVTAIQSYAFSDCTGLIFVSIPPAVTKIGISAFRGCTSLSSVTIPNLVDTIQIYTFYGCSGLSSITLSSSLTAIGSYVFYKCTSLTSVTIPSSVTTIGSETFYGCTGLTSVSMPPSVDQIGVSAFEGCTGLSSITIPSAVTTVEKYIFYGCTGLTSVIIPPSVTTIESSAFDGCKNLTSLIIPSLVTKIGQYAFYGCKSLTTINIPDQVSVIGPAAFDGCSGLNSIYSYATSPIDLSTSYSVFYNVNKTTCTLYVPAGSKSAYQAADKWKDFENIVEFATGLPTKEIPTIKLMPNPFTEGFWISGIEGSAKITIIDLHGKKQLMKQGVGNEYLSLKSLPKGMYIVKIITDKGITEKKMIKQ